jgi:glycosyltransferase involved in cell wall biosynthesis
MRVHAQSPIAPAQDGSHRAPRIAFAGPIAEPGKAAAGGYEAANRRTIDLLRQCGRHVLEFPYPVAHGSVIRKSSTYARGFAGIIAGLLRRRHDWDILHITPHLRQFLAAEAVLARAARRLGKRVLLDLRAGTLISGYNERGAHYRGAFQRFLAGADLLAVEGLCYSPFVRQWSDKPVFYFPNYVVQRDAAPHRSRQSPGEAGCIRLTTLGRIVPAKGVELALDVTEYLQSTGVPANLEVIGSGEPAYVERLKLRSRSLPVEFAGGLPPAEVAERLAGRHFFIFPTAHPGEGHSNALTEAMAAGLVPICSDHGFNRDVVGSSGVVLPKTAGIGDYAEAISKIGRDDRLWSKASKAAMERVHSHYTDRIVIPQLIDAYTGLMRPQDAADRGPLRSAA